MGLGNKLYTYEDRRNWNIPSYVKIGKGTYFVDGTRWSRFQDDETITIGNFCSISFNVQFVCGGCHRTDFVSTFPFDPKKTYNWDRPRNIVLGSDVWVGECVYVGGGTVVNHGAVLGTNSVIVGEVPPFAVMIGNPAKVLRYRFKKRIIKELLNIAWWDWPSDKLKAFEKLLYLPVEKFISEVKGV